MFLPMGIKGKRNRFSWITVTLIAINILAFMPRAWMGEGAYCQTIITLATETYIGKYFIAFFIHGNEWHLLGNMFFLWIFGAMLEDRIGRAEYLFTYLIGGMAASAAHYGFFFVFWPDIPCGGIGASGAVSALMGAFLIRFYFKKISLAPPLLPNVTLRIRVWVYLIMGTLFQLWNGLEMTANPNVYIGYWAHIGGFVFGMCYAIKKGYFREGRREWIRENAEESWEENTKTGMTSAVEEIGKALEISPDNIELLRIKGAIHTRFHLSAEGEDCYRRAIQGAFKQGKTEKALDIYIEYFQKYQGTFPAREQRILTTKLMAGNKIHLAAYGLEQWLKTNPVDKERHQMMLYLAHIYYKHFCATDTARALLLKLLSEKPVAIYEDVARERLARMPESQWLHPDISPDVCTVPNYKLDSYEQILAVTGWE